MTAPVLFLMFGGGFSAGVLALYSLWRFVLQTPAHASQVLRGVLEVAHVAHWVRDLDRVREEHRFCLVCPACGHAERAGRTAPRPGAPGRVP